VRRAIAVVVLLGAVAMPTSASATFPATNGKIGFTRGGDIWTVNADGTGPANLTNTTADEYCPLWAPGGGKIAFVGSELYVMNADGAGQLQVNPPESLYAACPEDWSPDATEIAYYVDDHCDVGGLWSVKADGSGAALHVCNGPTCPFDELFVDAGPRDPDFSPDGTKIAMRSCDPNDRWDLWLLGRDGSGYTRLTNSGGWVEAPDFSPSGAQIAFSGVEVIDVDGTNRHELHHGGGDPSWSPDGEKVGFRLSQDIWTVGADGTGATNVTNAAGTDFPFFWSPDAEKIVFSSNRTGSYDVYVINRNGTGLANITNTPGIDEQAFGWQGTQKGYPRPKGATPIRTPLVPAQKQCAAPDTTHGAPLSFGSCAPAQLASQYLTTGTPDANGRSTLMNASLVLSVVPGIPATLADEADVSVSVRVNDVFEKDLTDYTGELRANIPIRITDKNNTPAPNGPGPGTTQPFAFGFDIPCAGDPNPQIGSDCSLSTTIDTLVPGAILESRRSIWQLGQVRVFDGGADGDGSTLADNTVFATEGLFVP
jgi:Tol biopolymer transport system component